MLDATPDVSVPDSDSQMRAESDSEVGPTSSEWDIASEAIAELPEIANDQLSLRFNPEQGGDILSLVRRRDGLDVLWRSPWAMLSAGPRAGASAAARADEQWSGGWRSLFPHSGRNITSYGVDWGYDGEACLARYRYRFLSETTVELVTRLARTPFRITKTISLTGSTVRVSETVRNVGGQSIEVMWAQQICLGAPLLAQGAVIEAAATVVRPEPDSSVGTSYSDLTTWPRSYSRDRTVNLRRVPAADSDTTRLAYLSDFTENRISVQNPALKTQVDLSWDGEQYSHVWYELEAAGRNNFPHFSHSYYLSLSPATSWPRQGVNDARLQSQTTRWISPDEQASSWVELTISD